MLKSVASGTEENISCAIINEHVGFLSDSKQKQTDTDDKGASSYISFTNATSELEEASLEKANLQY